MLIKEERSFVIVCRMPYKSLKIEDNEGHSGQFGVRTGTEQQAGLRR